MLNPQIMDEVINNPSFPIGIEVFTDEDKRVFINPV